MTIEFDKTAAMEMLGYEQVWPVGQHWHGTPSVDAARVWWLDMMESVTVGVNEVPWYEEQYEQERQESIAHTAAEQAVATARRERRVLALCDLSELDRVLDDPRDGVVGMRLGRFMGEGGITVHQRSGEDPQEYEERRAQAEVEYAEESVRMLRLGSLAETYLTAAAEAVAERWAAAQYEAWTEANPEPDDEEE